ncbi:hypothetical protein ACU5AX_06540 [Sphingomonas sp. XXL09]|uniref:hypothetical protein n=1 Tax=Sphingomonas sp. XXL09 TaxID=3457787 RepID=UPI00406BBAF1
MTADIRLLRWPERDRDDFERLAAALARVRNVARRGRGEIVAEVPSGPEEPSDVERARVLFAQRRARDAAAGTLAELFGEPSWDLLLATFIAYEEGRELRLDAAAAAAGIRPLVAQRWLAVLVEHGLVHAGDDDGQNGTRLALTGTGFALVLRCIGDV